MAFLNWKASPPGRPLVLLWNLRDLRGPFLTILPERRALRMFLEGFCEGEVDVGEVEIQ